MLAGHYATGLIAHQQFPKGTLLFFLIVSQLQDLLWFVFHYLGLEPTTPTDVFNATVENLTVMMTYSHHAIPQLFWASAVFIIGRILFKSTTIGFAAMALFLVHFILDVFSGHAHHVFGAETQQVSFGLYASNIYLAIFIEVIFVVAALWFYFRQEKKAKVDRTSMNKAVIIGVFVYAILFLLVIATSSVRQLISLPEFDLEFNTSVPTLAITYAVLIWVLHKAISNHRLTNCSCS
jgi:hypothetical protein